MHDVTLILTLTTALTAALVLGFITHALRLSPIVGYLLAGVAVGPFTPGLEADHGVAEQLAEVGVILLMFGVGLHFHVRELLAVRGIAVPGALVQSAVATLLGALVGRCMGWDWPTAVIFGGATSVASTVVLVRVLSDGHDLHTRLGHVAVGWLVVEDLLTVVALVLLPTVLGAAPGSGGPAAALGLAAARIALLVALLVGVGGRVIPWVVERAAATRSRELFTLTVLVIALGIAVGSARVFGVSMALGAFLAGMIVGRGDYSLRAASEALPMRDAFAVLFFVSVGMLFDPHTLIEAPGLVAATLGIVLLAKPLAALTIALVLGYPLRIALPVAAALAQIGEFSFMLAAVARELGGMPDRAVDALVAAAIASITLNPLLYRAARLVEPALARRFAAAPDAAGAGDESPADAAHRAVVVGYGPVGQTVVQLLLDNGIEPTVIELNLETVRRLRTFDVRAVYGDASRPDILAEADVARARHLLLTAATGAAEEEIVRRARELNPGIRVVARTQFVRQVPAVRKAGAADVFADEGEVALAMTTSILGHLGATDEQIDRERARVEALFRSG
ncbi:MAG: sodium:proton exchanger [Planctomycetia bacterium]|nr:sodium:proton exchanger [Planctomycetia bacterium]